MPFPRSSGVLLHPTSLPGRFGIGDLGPSAFEFVNYLGSAGQRIWQVLPLGPTGYGDSPYQSFSAFAGNSLLISLDVLLEEGLLDESEMSRAPAFAPGTIDYEPVIAHRRELWPQLLDRFEAGGSAVHKRFDQFCRAQAAWLNDFALFMAVKDAHEQVAWTKWDADIAARQQTAIDWWSKHLEREVRVYKLTQFIFFEQWARLRAHCSKKMNCVSL